MKKAKFMSLIAILLMFVVALTCGFLFACGSNDDEDEVTDQDIVEEDPTTSTDPTEPTDPTDPTEPSESNEDVLVSIYDGTAENFGGNDCYADFRNLHELSVEMTTAEDGSAIYAIEGMATLMTKSQIYAFNAGENEGGAKTGDAFIIVEIAAPERSTINYNGIEVEVTSDPTDGVFIQGIRENGTKEMPVTITYEDGTTVSFVISLEGVTIPSDYIIGTWSNTIDATATLGEQEYNATADVEVTFSEDESFVITISAIGGDELSSYTFIINMLLPITISGTWTVSEGTYTLHFGEDDADSTFTMAENATEIELSFSMSYSILSYNLEIKVENQSLVPGTLAENSSEPED